MYSNRISQYLPQDEAVHVPPVAPAGFVCIPVFFMPMAQMAAAMPDIYRQALERAQADARWSRLQRRMFSNARSIRSVMPSGRRRRGNHRWSSSKGSALRVSGTIRNMGARTHPSPGHLVRASRPFLDLEALAAPAAQIQARRESP